MTGILENIIAAIIYDAAIGRFRKLEDILLQAFTNTSIHFSGRSFNPIELNQEKFRKFLSGETMINEIERFREGKNFFNKNRLALDFASLCDLYFEDENEILPNAIEILDYFVSQFEQLLLEDPKNSAFVLRTYLKVYARQAEEEHRLIKKSLEDLVNQLKRLESLSIYKYSISGGDLERLREIKKVFVEPQCYAVAANILKNKRLAIIVGPAHSGKTSLALFLGNLLKENRFVDEIIVCPSGISLDDLKRIKKVALIFDDPFGGAKFNPMFSSIGDRFDLLFDLAIHNFVIITSRREIFDEALFNTKLGERNNLEEYMVNLGPEDYSERSLIKMITKHMDYNKVSQHERQYVNEHIGYIINGLNSPHSIKIFVSRQLKAVVNKRKQLSESLREANEIENVVGRWFESYYKKDKDIFYFLFTLSLIPGADTEHFARVHKLFVETIRNQRHLDIEIPSHYYLPSLVAKTKPYVSSGYTINFIHPSYRQGIISIIKKQFLHDLEVILPCCEILGGEKDWFLRTSSILCLVEIGSVLPDLSIESLRKLLVNDWRREQYARHALCELGKTIPDKVIPVLEQVAKHENWSVSNEAQQILAEIGTIVPDKVIPIFLKWVEDKSNPDRSIGVYFLEKILITKFDEVLPFLKKWAKDDDWLLRKAVAICLRNIVRQKPEDLLPILNTLLKDEEWLVRRSAELAISKYYHLK